MQVFLNSFVGWVKRSATQRSDLLAKIVQFVNNKPALINKN